MLSSIVRVPIVFTLAGTMTVSLFQLMNHFVAMGEVQLDDPTSGGRIEFARVRQDSRANHRERALPQKIEKQTPPQTPEVERSESSSINAVAVNVGGVEIETSLALTDVTLGAQVADSEEVPIVRVEPIYPIHAAEMGIEGWVILRFDITTTGATANVVVVEAEPTRLFDKAAIRAVEKWKYRPKVIDGKARIKRNLKVRLRFNLNS